MLSLSTFAIILLPLLFPPAYAQTDKLLDDGKQAIGQFQSLWQLLHSTAEHSVIAVGQATGHELDPTIAAGIIFAAATIGMAFGLRRWIKNFLVTLAIGAAIAAIFMFVPIFH